MRSKVWNSKIKHNWERKEKNNFPVESFAIFVILKLKRKSNNQIIGKTDFISVFNHFIFQGMLIHIAMWFISFSIAASLQPGCVKQNNIMIISKVEG